MIALSMVSRGTGGKVSRKAGTGGQQWALSHAITRWEWEAVTITPPMAAAPEIAMTGAMVKKSTRLFIIETCSFVISRWPWRYRRQ
jgi:hypothetical protein